MACTFLLRPWRIRHTAQDPIDSKQLLGLYDRKAESVTVCVTLARCDVPDPIRLGAPTFVESKI
jgi:hypothetical protein